MLGSFASHLEVVAIRIILCDAWEFGAEATETHHKARVTSIFNHEGNAVSAGRIWAFHFVHGSDDTSAKPLAATQSVWQTSHSLISPKRVTINSTWPTST